MRVLVVEHQRDAGPGVFAQAVEMAGASRETWRPAEGEPPPARLDHDAVIVLGGAVNVEDAPPWMADELAALGELLDRGTPILGMCLGAQLLAEAAGGAVRRAATPEIGWFEVTVADGDDPLVGPLSPSFEAFEWHSFEAVPPPGAAVLAHTPVCPQAFRIGDRAWGLQFHAEVDAETAARWITDYRSDPDAVRLGVDPDRLLEQTSARLAAQNELGRGLCTRFLANG